MGQAKAMSSRRGLIGRAVALAAAALGIEALGTGGAGPRRRGRSSCAGAGFSFMRPGGGLGSRR